MHLLQNTILIVFLCCMTSYGIMFCSTVLHYDNNDVRLCSVQLREEVVPERETERERVTS